MFQPETEDMLPRAAPRPSASLAQGNTAAEIARPTVPEVSIILGGAQQSTNLHAKPTQQTYAAWKKQVLPKVTFPPVGAEVYSIDGHVVGNHSTATTPRSNHSVAAIVNGSAGISTVPSNIYPLRTIAVTANVPTSSIGMQCPTNALRRSLESTTSMQTPTTPELLHQQRRSLDAAISSPNYASSREVLTICAGTQTEMPLATASADATSHLDEMLENLATKADIQQLLTVVNAMRMEQLRITQLNEALFIKLETANSAAQIVRQCDASTQCYEATVMEEKNEVPYQTRNYDAAPANVAKYNYQQTSKQIQPPPRAQAHYPLASPAAQSTAYQTNTPSSNCASPTTVATAAPLLSKQSTEQSYLMNELALKYLPNEKLNELLQELNIAKTTAVATPISSPGPLPLRQIDNLDRAPNDISNASYKYLQKYRLLPEERIALPDQEQQSPRGGGQSRMRSPLTAHARQQQSPYQPQIQTQTQPQQINSPLAADGTPRAGMLDLEHIRRQPKLL